MLKLRPFRLLLWGAWALGMMLLPAAAALADQFAKLNNNGNRLYEDGKLDAALEQYRSAKLERPEASQIDYNIGNVLHSRGTLDSALAAYQNAALSSDSVVRPHAYYNMGNTLYRGSKYDLALEAYRQALIEDPNDLDAKHNLELALRQMVNDSTPKQPEPKPDEQQSDSTQQQQQQPDSSQQSQDEQQQNSDRQDQEQQDQQSANQQDTEQSPADQRKSQSQLEGMTPQDAQRLLDALKQDESDLQKKRAQRIKGVPVARDW
jgi:tetratricopeptide (TPR) repeat protein